MSWWIEFRVERPTFLVPRISNQQEERARSSDEKMISSKSQLVMFNNGIQSQRIVRDENMILKVHPAGTERCKSDLALFLQKPMNWSCSGK